MKAFIWILVLACAVWSVCCWAVSHIVASMLSRSVNWPGMTELLLNSNGWILLFPFPWLIYAVFLSRCSNLTPNAVFLFVGTVVLALSILICAVAFACLLPFFH
jgi:hypothetical protein